jgi:hypothetical protein
LWGRGVGNFAVMADFGRAPVEERGGGAGARRRARRPELGGMSSAAPRGCYGTCVRGRKHTEQGRRCTLPN